MSANGTWNSVTVKGVDYNPKSALVLLLAATELCDNMHKDQFDILNIRYRNTVQGSVKDGYFFMQIKQLHVIILPSFTVIRRNLGILSCRGCTVM